MKTVCGLILALATASGDSCSVTHQPESVLGEHGSFVNCLAFTWDSRRLVSGGEDGIVRIWDIKSGKVLDSLRAHVKPVTSLALSPDGILMATVSSPLEGVNDSGGEVKLWNLENQKELIRFTAHKAYISGVAFSADGKSLITCSYDKTVKVWDTSNGKEKATLNKHKEPVSVVKFSRDGKYFATGAWDRNVVIWDAETLKERLALDGHKVIIWSLAFSSDGKTIATGGGESFGIAPAPVSELKLWSAGTGKERSDIKGHVHYVDDVAFALDNKVLASLSIREGIVRLWSTDAAKELGKLSDRTRFYFMALSPDGKTLATSDKDGNLKIWNVQKAVASQKGE